MQLSLVMPNLFDHGSAERQYGDLIRIDNDASFGTWYFLSADRQTWQPIWSQWDNPFLGFTGFSDVSGAGQVILDGDPVGHQLVRQRRRTGDRHLAVHHGRSGPGHHRPYRHHRRRTPASSRTRRCWPSTRRGWWASRSTTTPIRSPSTRPAGIRSGGRAAPRRQLGGRPVQPRRRPGRPDHRLHRRARPHWPGAGP